MASLYNHCPLMEAPSDRGKQVTATNKSEIAKLKMYQFVIFRSAGFLEMATMTNAFPTIAALSMMINKNDSTIAAEKLRFNIVALTDVPTFIVFIWMNKLPSHEIKEKWKSVIYFSQVSLFLVSLSSQTCFAWSSERMEIWTITTTIAALANILH